MSTAGIGEANASVDRHASALPIVPNYISNPPFPYVSGSNDQSQQNNVSAVPSSFVVAGNIRIS